MVELTRIRDVTVIEVGAAYDSLDEDALDDFGDVLLTHAVTVDPPSIVVDLSKTSFIGSMFIELLVRAWKRLSQRGGHLALCGLHPFCAEVLQTSRLDTIWSFFPDRSAAVDALAAGDEEVVG
jgi:anti-sigma B factor antagonist